MATVRSVITGALRKLAVVGGVGRRTPSAFEFADALPQITSLYRTLITSGAFGRLRDVVPRGDYVAGENQRIYRRFNEAQEILLPDLVSWCGSCGYLGCDPVQTTSPSVPSCDYGARPYGYHDGSQRRTVRDNSVVTLVDEFSGDILESIYDGQRKAWFTINDIDYPEELDETDPLSVARLNAALDLEAPLSHRDLNGLSCLLSTLLADDYSADVSDSVQRQAYQFKLNLVGNYSTYKREDIVYAPVSYARVNPVNDIPAPTPTPTPDPDPDPTPSPSFAAQPTVNPVSGLINQTYTASPGTVINGTITSRAWLLAGVQISTGLTATPTSAGSLSYQEFAGSVASNIITVAVAVPVPAFVSQPTVNPASGVSGQTYTATSGTVSNGVVTSREWKLDGTTISTDLTATPTAAGSLTYTEYSGSVASNTITIAVAVPAPAFVSQPTVSPATGTAGATTYTATPGQVSNGTVTSREWKQNGTTISTSLTASPAASGSASTLTYQEFSGAVASDIVSVSVAATPASFSSQPTVNPGTGTAGQTTFTATPGTVNFGSVTSRAWKLNGTTISTALTAQPSSSGTLTYQEFSGAVGSNIISRTVAAAPVSMDNTSLLMDGTAVTSDTV